MTYDFAAAHVLAEIRRVRGMNYRPLRVLIGPDYAKAMHPMLQHLQAFHGVYTTNPHGATPPLMLRMARVPIGPMRQDGIAVEAVPLGYEMPDGILAPDYIDHPGALL